MFSANRVLLLSIGLISCLSFFSCDAPPVIKTPPVPVNLYTVTQQSVMYYDNYPSTTQALSQVNIMPEVQGYITGIFFKDGSEVKKGQVLYEIDKRLYQSAYDGAVANLKVVEGNLEQAQQDADRYEYLNKNQAVAKQLYDHAMVALKNAKNQVNVAEQAVKTAKTNLAYSIITAPFDGTIGFSQVKQGNMVTIGQTVLNTISTDNPMAVDFLVNEKQLPAFEKLQKGDKASPDSLFTMLLPDNSLYNYTGKISVIDRAVDPQTGSIKVRLVFPNPKNDLKVGMSCVVRVHNLETKPQMLIPTKAIVEQMGEYFVYVAKDTVVKADTTVKKTDDSAQTVPRLRAIQKKVKVGQTIGENIIILSGINVGDKVIVDGVQAVHDGSAIALGNKKPVAEKGKEGKDGGTKPEGSKHNQSIN